MATLYVTEFAGIMNDMQFARAPAIAEQTIAIGAGSVQSAAFNAATTLVRLSADAVCSVAFGANPTATATTARLPANSVEYFGVAAGTKVAAITNT